MTRHGAREEFHGYSPSRGDFERGGAGRQGWGGKAPRLGGEGGVAPGQEGGSAGRVARVPAAGEAGVRRQGTSATAARGREKKKKKKSEH